MDPNYSAQANDPSSLSNRKEISLLFFYLNKKGVIKRKITIKELTTAMELLFGYDRKDFEQDLLKFHDGLEISNRSKDYEGLVNFLNSTSGMVKFDQERYLWNNYLV
jgi:hypothetical protein